MTKTKSKKAKNIKTFDCRKCKYMQHIPGDAHVECVHPKIKKSTRDRELSAIVSVLAMLGGGRGIGIQTKSAEELGIKLNPIGVRGGWANWPMNFDPCWIELCKGYKKVDSK